MVFSLLLAFRGDRCAVPRHTVTQGQVYIHAGLAALTAL
jgi:hypothetical protein